jgi:hypothetical protein
MNEGAAINELLASAMRNPERTGGWEGAEKVAQCFDRAADRARAALTAAQDPHP